MVKPHKHRLFAVDITLTFQTLYSHHDEFVDCYIRTDVYSGSGYIVFIYCCTFDIIYDIYWKLIITMSNTAVDKCGTGST